MIGRRLWLALIVALCGVPLFVGLGQADLEHDEAIYSFAVDRILETGNWLEPKSIPNEDWAFLEKPPLKFWIVAAPIRLGVLPHDEFGLRFWDAFFGALAFVYVFLIGARLVGPLCGAVAVLILVGQPQLLFTHGLRNNNMEAPLLLAYCGGIYHFLAWSRWSSLPVGRARPAGHALATGLYFVLGFMTKFVAVFFLPLVLGSACLLLPPLQKRVAREWRLWLAVGGLVLGLVAPWFLWASLEYGAALWRMMVAEHVYARFTASLDPTHLQPWHYYLSSMVDWFGVTGVLWLIGPGLILLSVLTVRRRSVEGAVLLLWFALPVALMSAGTSKLYHYLYPFLPPAALAGGYLVNLAWLLAPVPFGRAMAAWNDFAESRAPGVVRRLRRPISRRLLLALAALAVSVALLTIVGGPVRVVVGGTELLRSSSILRPTLVAFLCGALAGAIRGSSPLVLGVLLASTLPIPAYREALGRLTAEARPIRTVRDCVLGVDTREGRRGLYVDTPAPAIPHPVYYYLRRVRPWVRAADPGHSEIGRYLYDPEVLRPVLISEPTYQAFWHPSDRIGSARPVATSPPMAVFDGVPHNILLLLPGPYAACAPESPGRPARR